MNGLSVVHLAVARTGPTFLDWSAFSIVACHQLLQAPMIKKVSYLSVLV